MNPTRKEKELFQSNEILPGDLVVSRFDSDEVYWLELMVVVSIDKDAIEAKFYGSEIVLSCPKISNNVFSYEGSEISAQIDQFGFVGLCNAQEYQVGRIIAIQFQNEEPVLKCVAVGPAMIYFEKGMTENGDWKLERNIWEDS